MRTLSLCLFAATVALHGTAFAQGSGPIAAYHFNEGTGTLVADVSGNGLSGTVSGAAWTTAGRHGGALMFDASTTG